MRYLPAMLCYAGALCAALSASAERKTHCVPADHPTIQAAIDAAGDGDTVLVAPGVYHEGLRIAGKSVVLTSEFANTNDQQTIRDTILDGSIKTDDGAEGVRDQVILVERSAGPATEIVGFTIRNGDDGISCYAKIRIAHNYFTANVDAIDYEGGGGVCEHNLFEKNADDAVDLDLDCAVVVANNLIRDNDDDGIEIRLHDYQGETLEIVIRDNTITGNGEDGIQIIDYPEKSNRHLRIERNLIAGNAMAGIGCMSDGNTKENYEAAPIPEPIEIVNNTIVDNEYGITGGANVVAVNNIVAGHKMTAIKQVDGQSSGSHNLFWNNGADLDASEWANHEVLRADPRLDKQHRLQADSPAIDAGVATFAAPAGRIEISSGKYSGAAPDLGAFEFAVETAAR